ncbi:MotA/TolQ/ExbB proton channel family protein [Anthocerotibacter panamensis]|uniref:MotA/TolQ/ExbB proton channel family protein n=1 Tax=Anthocerotibacter panamensis TaxID=2857077 RepID=UPI001C40313C|nr:MotA/TolQ/ExbB proton channel family protein [Anthocerotibacter panamensis]
MYPLFFFSITSISLIIERAFFWRKVSVGTPAFLTDVLSTYKRKSLDATVKVCEQYKDLPVARIFGAAFRLGETDEEQFRLAMESATSAEVPILRKWTTLFDTIIQASPLIGLVGTITGLIRALSNINLGGGAGSEQISQVTSGIGEALIATATGITIALITLLLTNIFRSLYNRQIAIIGQYSGELEIIHRKRSETSDYAPTTPVR